MKAFGGWSTFQTSLTQCNYKSRPGFVKYITREGFVGQVLMQYVELSINLIELLANLACGLQKTDRSPDVASNSLSFLC